MCTSLHFPEDFDQNQRFPVPFMSNNSLLQLYFFHLPFFAISHSGLPLIPHFLFSFLMPFPSTEVRGRKRRETITQEPPSLNSLSSSPLFYIHPLFFTLFVLLVLLNMIIPSSYSSFCSTFPRIEEDNYVWPEDEGKRFWTRYTTPFHEYQSHSVINLFSAFLFHPFHIGSVTLLEKRGWQTNTQMRTWSSSKPGGEANKESSTSRKVQTNRYEDRKTGT